VNRPRLAPGFTVLIGGESPPSGGASAKTTTNDGTLWLVAGEDVRYRLGTADPQALADLLARCDGTRSIDELGPDARDIITRLYEERVLVDGTPAQAHVAGDAGFRVTGSGALVEALRGGTGAIEVFVQDSLDHRALLAKNRAALAAHAKWMWITTGPGGRAYVGPLFVPGAGPCAACLLVHFKRLSPVPELYDVVLAHEGAIAPTPFPPEAIAATAALARWKLSLAANPFAAPLYALHVVEVADLTITSHAPLADLECTECR
jgi:bacteriocin biosynthesis cyclodehydratase domain-containing protein